MKTTLLATTLCALLVTQAHAEQVTAKKEEKSAAKAELQLKGMTILSDRANGFAPNNGTGYMARMKFETADLFVKGLKITAGTYVNGMRAEFDKNSAADGYIKAAYGMGLSPNDNGAMVGILGEAFLSYDNKLLSARLGRQTIDTPLTQIRASLTPNFYEAYMFSSQALEGLKLTAGHITKMAYGSRSAPDSGIIGENTSTAGAIANLIRPTTSAVEQAKFYNIGQLATDVPANALGSATLGRSVAGATYSGIKNLNVDAWVYHSYDIATDYYVEASYKMPVTKALNAKFDAQYLTQQADASSVTGERNFHMMGAKASVGNKKYGAFVALNKSLDNENSIAGQYFNIWGADPAYTSTIFSRNAYRTNVTAYKVGAHYVLMKGLKFMVHYANYGQSNTTMGGHTTATAKGAKTNAYEVDTVIAYKPTKTTMLKLFWVHRVSEFDGWAAPGISDERRMDQIRFIASHTFK